jgi:uncharacterized glyoxalase superfamily protein PhnB
MARAPTITPVLRYADAGAAAHWLCEVFGFQEHDRAQDLGGNVRYVSLRFGDSFVLVRPVANSTLDNLMVQPGEIGGINTQSCYLTVPDVADHCARAEAAGAKVEIKPQDDGLGGRFYSCRDPEGHLWSFGTRTYGATQEVASAFEPVEIGPSLPITRIALSPQGVAPARASRRGLLREIAIAAATAVLVVGALLYYDTYARQASTDVAAARLEEAIKQLARERSRRLLAEGASRKAAISLAEARTAATQLQQAIQRIEAELADTRQDKEQAVRALATANELSQKHGLARDRAEAEVVVAQRRIAETEAKLTQLTTEGAAAAQARPAEQEQINLREKEELQEARTALLAANKVIEQLRAGQLEPQPADSSDRVPDDAPCVLAVQGKIAWGHKGPTNWAIDDLNRLCRGAEKSEEPGKCFQEIMLGKVNWGGGSTWATSNALALCSATQSARKTLDCFKSKISENQSWRIAIRQCRNN